jgi:hypothetical protein
MITKSQDIVLSRDIDLSATYHEGRGDDSILLNFHAANHGFSSSIHLSISDAKNFLNVLNHLLGEKE